MSQEAGARAPSSVANRTSQSTSGFALRSVGATNVGIDGYAVTSGRGQVAQFGGARRLSALTWGLRGAPWCRETLDNGAIEEPDVNSDVPAF